VGRTNEYQPFDGCQWTVKILFSCQVCSFISSSDSDSDSDDDSDSSDSDDIV
jgi:hypothetical protein